MNKRLEYVDVAKFLGIVLVIFAHCLDGGQIRAMLYSFHLPLFFILNGITMRFRENENFGSYFTRKAKNYIIPMFFLGIILLIVEGIQKQNHGQILSDTYMLDGIVYLVEQKRAFPIWFVGALFIADLLFYAVWKLGKNKLLPMSVISSLCLCLAIYLNLEYQRWLPWNFDVAIFGVFFIYFGYMFSHSSFTKIRNFVLQKRFISLLIGLILMSMGLTLAMINFNKYNLHLEMWAMLYQKYYLVIPSAIISSFGFIFLCNSISNKVLAELGKTTLFLLAFHQIVSMTIFKDLFPEWYHNFCVSPKENINHYYFPLVETLFCLVTILPAYYLTINTPLCIFLNKKMPTWLQNIIKKIYSWIFSLKKQS